ncbi:hypothetical protein [Listeria rustica]|nr:hypothetical protein [Listeria rustica]
MKNWKGGDAWEQAATSIEVVRKQNEKQKKPNLKEIEKYNDTFNN